MDCKAFLIYAVMSNTEYKTIREWFEEFPEPYRTQALGRVKATDKRQFESAKSALSSGFIWAKSKEGGVYWSKFHDTL